MVGFCKQKLQWLQFPIHTKESQMFLLTFLLLTSAFYHWRLWCWGRIIERSSDHLLVYSLILSLSLFLPFLLSFSPMFYHRVLPPPPKLTVPTTTSSPLVASKPLIISGSPHEDRMTTIVDRSPFPHVDHGSLRNHQYREQEDHQFQRPTRASDLSSPISLRASTRLSRKREASRSPPVAGPQRSGQSRLPSISRDGDLTNKESPTHVCLCQPDPKVPRPRNGM